MYVKMSAGDVRKLSELAMSGTGMAKQAAPGLSGAGIGAIGGALVGAAADSMTPRDEDENRLKRLLMLVLENAALGSVAGYGISKFAQSPVGAATDASVRRSYDDLTEEQKIALGERLNRGKPSAGELALGTTGGAVIGSLAGAALGNVAHVAPKLLRNPIKTGNKIIDNYYLSRLHRGGEIVVTDKGSGIGEIDANIFRNNAPDLTGANGPGAARTVSDVANYSLPGQDASFEDHLWHAANLGAITPERYRDLLNVTRALGLNDAQAYKLLGADLFPHGFEASKANANALALLQRAGIVSSGFTAKPEGSAPVPGFDASKIILAPKYRKGSIPLQQLANAVLVGNMDAAEAYERYRIRPDSEVKAYLDALASYVKNPVAKDPLGRTQKQIDADNLALWTGLHGAEAERLAGATERLSEVAPTKTGTKTGPMVNERAFFEAANGDKASSFVGGQIAAARKARRSYGNRTVGPNITSSADPTDVPKSVRRGAGLGAGAGVFIGPALLSFPKWYENLDTRREARREIEALAPSREKTTTLGE